MFRTFLQSQRALQRASPISRYFIRPQPTFSSFLHTSTSLTKSKELEPLPETFAEKYKLYDPTRWVPITIGSFALATATGLYHWDSESQMLGLFVLFVATIYSQAGDAIGKYFDDQTEAIFKTQRDSEDLQIKGLNMQIDAIKKFTDAEKEVADYLVAMKKLKEDMAIAAPNRFEQRKAKFFLDKLDRAMRQEAELKEEFNRSLITKATVKATTTFENDKNLQKQSLSSALKWLQTPDGQKQEMTEAGALFTAFFKNVKKDPSVTADIESKINAEMNKIVKGEQFEVVDEFMALNSTN